jgi:hypothetical protein
LKLVSNILRVISDGRDDVSVRVGEAPKAWGVGDKPGGFGEVGRDVAKEALDLWVIEELGSSLSVSLEVGDEKRTAA